MKQRALLGYVLAWGIAGVFLGILASLSKTVPETTMDQAMLATFLLGGAIAGTFISHSGHAGLRGIGLEIGSGLLLWLGWMVIGLGLNFLVRCTVPSPVDRWSMLFFILSIAPGLLAYGVTRFVRWAWRHWTRLRKTRFLWSLTNSHLVVVTGLVFLLDLMAVLGAFLRGNLSAFLLITSHEIPLALALLLQVVIWLGSLALLLGFSLTIALPASALFSLWVARRQIRRLEALAQAANLLRKGELSARVPVEGQDELAQLQADFNQMSADLEQALLSLRDERDKVKSLLQIQRNLTANISHDLRTPLTLLHGALESDLEHQQANLTSEVSNNMRVMLHQVQQLEALVGDMFTLSQAQANRLSICIETVAPAEIIQRIVDATAPLAWQMRRVKVYAELPEDVSNIQADSTRLEQALQNLVQNGIYHTAPGGFVAITLEDEPDEFRFDVIDSGEGIPPEEIEHIWERYYRGDSNHTTGAGLGLAIVKELVTAMQGRVAVESTPGEGSRFSIFLPKA